MQRATARQRQTRRPGLGWVVLFCALVASPALLVTPAVAQPADAVPVELIREIDRAREEHARILSRFEADRQRFDALLDEIDRLKDERDTAGTLANDADLRGALRRARESAEALRAQSGRLGELADQIVAYEEALLSALDDRRAELEAAVRQSSSQHRSALLHQLSELTELRAAYEQPLPAVPVVPLAEILLGLDDDSSPEELLMTADELQDNAYALDQYLVELDDRIQELERRGAMMDRSREFERERSLFEEYTSTGQGERSRPAVSRSEDGGAETAGSGAGQQREGEATDGGGAPPSAPEDSGSEGDETVNAGTADGQDSSDPTPAAGFNDDGAQAGPGGGDSDAESSGGAPAENTDGDGLADDSGGGTGVSPDARSDEPNGTFDPGAPDPVPSLSPTVTGVGRAQDDPVLLMLGTPNGSSDEGTGLDAELNQLRRERERTRRTREELIYQREQLLIRVEELESSEGL